MSICVSNQGLEKMTFFKYKNNSFFESEFIFKNMILSFWFKVKSNFYKAKNLF